MRYEDLTESTLDKSYVIARSHFSPEPLARRFKQRLRDLIDRDAAMGAILQIPLENEEVCLAAATWVFVDDETYARFRVCPPEEVDTWIVDRVLCQGGGVLSRDEVGRANARQGLHLLVLYFKADDDGVSDQGRITVVQEMMSHIFRQFTGYNLRSLTARVRHQSQITSGIQAGARVLRPDALPSAVNGEHLPVTVLMHAERASVDFASWIAGAFVCRKPRFAFSAAEQRTLVLAERGHRDDEIAAMCAISRSTVKKRWDSIFARVAAVAPELFDSAEGVESLPGRRGREKRGTLLGYLADHPEELRPYQP